MAVFGLLGSGNIGNEGSVEAVLRELRRRHQHVHVWAICAGPDDVNRRYGIPATSMTCFRLDRPPASRFARIAIKAIGKVLDVPRLCFLVRRADLVIVPGMGVLEDTLPLHPWGFPYALAGLSLAGRLTRTPVALVSVGASRARDPLTRLLLGWAARAATYRSFRDLQSRDAASVMGVPTHKDPVYPDLAFGLPLPPHVSTAAQPTVAVGVMEYRGRQEDHALAEDILASYTSRITQVVLRLVDEGYRIRLLTGDPADAAVADAVQETVRRARPSAAASAVMFEPVDSLSELMRQMVSVDAVIASRYHNVLCALRLEKPTIALGYASKTEALMAYMGMGAFCRDIRDFDPEEVFEQLGAALEQSERIQAVLRAREVAAHKRLAGQWRDLAGLLTPSA